MMEYKKKERDCYQLSEFSPVFLTGAILRFVAKRVKMHLMFFFLLSDKQPNKVAPGGPF